MNHLVINTDQGRETISRNIYGHFAEHLGRCIYGGIWVGGDNPIPNTRGIRNDIVEALRRIRIPVLRWPGGCFADSYHWMDGIGPPEERPAMLNTHWGMVTENNHFGTHEFLDLCSLLGCEPYICGNVGSGTVRQMQQWVEYLSFPGSSPMADLRRANGRNEPWKVTYWGVGNENWGCGGNMRPEYYADLFRQFSTYLRNYGDNRLFKIACGPNGDNYEWTEVLMRQAAGKGMHGLALHYYTSLVSLRPDRKKGSATRFDEGEWFGCLKAALRIDELITLHSAIMDRYDPAGKVALVVDEWGTWWEAEDGTNPAFLYQQNTLRDALAAAASLDVFNKNCKRVKMANIAQTVNVLQAMVLTEGERMLLTPTYHVFEMYTVHHDATLLPIELAAEPYAFGDQSIPGLSATASRDAAGKVHLTISNLNPNRAADVTCILRGGKFSRATGRILTAPTMQAHNTFDKPDQVAPSPFTGAKIDGEKLSVNLPGKSVVVIELE